MTPHHAEIARVGDPGRKFVINPRCPAAVRRVNTKAGLRIYLVDNKQGGIDSASLMYTVPNLNYCGAF
jgi:hypothetical protein